MLVYNAFNDDVSTIETPLGGRMILRSCRCLF